MRLGVDIARHVFLLLFLLDNFGFLVAPIFEELAMRLEGFKNIVIAEYDAT